MDAVKKRLSVTSISWVDGDRMPPEWSSLLEAAIRFYFWLRLARSRLLIPLPIFRRLVGASWPDLAVFALGLTANEPPPEYLEGQYDDKNSEHYKGYRARISYEYCPEEGELTKGPIIWPGWTPPALQGFGAGREAEEAREQKGTASEKICADWVNALKAVFPDWVVNVGEKFFTGLLRYSEGEAGAYSKSGTGERSGVKFGKFHDHSYLRGVLEGQYDVVLVNALAKVRAGETTDWLGRWLALSPRHVPWVWCEHALVKRGDRYFMCLAGSKFPSHSLFLNGKKICKLEIESEELKGNREDAVLTSGAIQKKFWGGENPVDDKVTGPVKDHRNTVGPPVQIACYPEHPYTVDAAKHVCYEVTKYIEAQPDEQKESGKGRSPGLVAARKSPARSAGAAAKMRVGKYRPVVDPPELVTCPRSKTWDGKGEITVVDKTTHSLAVGSAGVLSNRLEFWIFGCSDGAGGQCLGAGSIEPADHPVRVKGRKVLLESDKGTCSGTLSPLTGSPIPCECEVSFKKAE